MMSRTGIVLIAFIGAVILCFAAQDAAADPITFSVSVTTSTRLTYSGDVENLDPPVTFLLNLSFTPGPTFYTTMSTADSQIAELFMFDDASSISTTPFTQDLLNLAGGVPLDSSDQSSFRQSYAHYTDPDQPDLSGQELNIAQQYDYVDTDTNMLFEYARDLTITLANPFSSMEDVQTLSPDAVANLVNGALSGDPGYDISYSEFGVWRDMTKGGFTAGFQYSSEDVHGVQSVPELATLTLMIVGCLGLFAVYCARGAGAPPERARFDVIGVARPKS
jgi:hypothetical protein